MSRAPRRGGARRAGAAMGVLMMLSAQVLLGAGSAEASTGTPVAPTQAAGGEFAHALSFSITAIAPEVISSAGGNVLTVKGTMKNTGKQNLTGLEFVVQRGTSLNTTAAVKAELADPSQPTAVITSNWTPIGANLAAGASEPFTASVAIAGDPTDSLAISGRGVYPVMININGDVGTDQFHARVGELHLVTTVVSVPAVPVTPTTPASGSTAAPTTVPTSVPTPVPAPTPIPLAMLWPIVDRPHLGVNGIFLDDGLAQSVSPGGRLDGVLKALETNDFGAQSVTLSIDPELLDELDRMSKGYRVVAPGKTQPLLTPAPPTPSSSRPARRTGADSSATESGSTSSAAISAGSTSTGAVTSAGSTSTTDTASTTTSASTVSSATTAGTPAGGLTDSAASTPATSAPATSLGVPATANTSPSTSTSTSSTPTTATTATTATTKTTPAAPPPANTVRGVGQLAATSFLVRLRALAAQHPVLVLPYSDPDAVAMVDAGQSAQLTALTTLGRQMAERILGGNSSQAADDFITQISVPVNGLADVPTLSVLSAAGYQAAVMAGSAVHETGPAAGSVALSLAGSGSMPAAVADSALVAPVTTLIDNTTTKTSTVLQTNSLAALMAAQSFSNTATPLVLNPDARWTVSPVGLDHFAALTKILAGGGVIAGTSLPKLATIGTKPATVTYPPSARAAQLPVDYLSSINDAKVLIGRLRGTLVQNSAADPNPADLLRPLTESLNRVYSAGLRGDQSAGNAIVATSTATLTTLEAGVSIRSCGQCTLASSNSPLTVTVQNTLPYAVRVSVAITGGASSGLKVTPPPAQVVPAGRSLPIKIATQVSKSGTFSVSAFVLAADGAQMSAPTQIIITSSAYGAVTIVLIAVAGGVLLLMVIFRISQRWRARKARLLAESGALVALDPSEDSIVGSAQEQARVQAQTPIPDHVADPGNDPGNDAEATEDSLPHDNALTDTALDDTALANTAEQDGLTNKNVDQNKPNRGGVLS